MKALVYHGPGKRSWDDVPYPVLQEPGDVIVIGTHGRGASTAALLGSVSRRLLHAADCPVLVVTPSHDRHRAGVAAL